MFARKLSRIAPSPAALLFASLLVVACGGGSDTTSPPGGNNPPGNPPANTTPASLALVAGDAQTAIPGANVTIKPVVVVKNSAGAGVSGVTVTFSVDSGNGSLQSTSVTTSADGTASPGDWRLGAAEGRNVILASVASLAAVKIVATAVVTPVTVAGQSVPTAGGVVTLNQQNSTLNGATLTIPSGALSGTSTIGFTISSAASLTLPAGMTAVSPALTVTGLTTALKQPGRLRLPVVAPAGKVLVVLSQDGAGGAYSVLHSVSRNATGITVALGTVEAVVPAAAVRTSLLAPQQPIIIAVTIDPALLARDFDSNFRPGTDDWEFHRELIASQNAPTGYIDAAGSMVATSLWYFVNRKAGDGKLFEKYTEAKGIPESNRKGHRWASVADAGFPLLWGQGALAEITRANYNANAPTLAQDEMNEIKAAFLLSGNKPQPIFLFTATNAVVDTEPRFGAAYRTVGNAVDIVVPDAPGKTFRIALGTGGWTPVSITTAGNVTYTVDFIAPIQYAIFVQDAALAPQFPLVTAGTIGDAQGWPKPELTSEFGTLDTANVYLVDALRHWWECTVCPDNGYRVSTLPTSVTHAMPFRRSTQQPDLSWGTLDKTPLGSMNYDLADLGNRATVRQGTVLYKPSPGSSASLIARPAWLDWTTAVYKKLPVDIKNDTVLTFEDTTVVLTLTAPGMPSGSSYRWKHYSKTKDSAETTQPTFSKRITQQGLSTLYGEVLTTSNSKKRAIGRDSTRVLYANGWQLQTVSLTSVVLPPGGIGSDDTDTLIFNFINQSTVTMQQTPAGSLLYHSRDPNGSCRVLALETFANVPIDDTNPVPSAFRAALGINCNDPDLGGTYVVGIPGKGTVVGTAFATDADPDVIAVPGGSINATMNGTKLQGTFIWKIRYSTGIALYTYNFQANMLIPK